MNRGKTNLKIKCVIYDCDGVLFDSLEANGRLYNDLCASAGRGPVKEEEMKYVHSHTVFESIRYLFKHDEKLEEKALELQKQVDLSKYIVYLKMEPHLFEALNLLKGKGIHRAINTNRTTSMKYIMERFDLWPHFDLVVTALDVKNPKPHPESIEKILASLKLEREETIFVGDSEVDRQTAERSGVLFVAYKNREIAKDLLIEDHLDLLRHLSDEKAEDY